MCNMTQKIVQIKQGWLEGKSAVDYKGGCYFSFQGIPYAKPPLNELRFKVGSILFLYLFILKIK